MTSPITPFPTSTTSHDRISLGQRIKAERLRLGMSLTELATAIGTSHGSLSNIENERFDPSGFA